MQVLTILPNAFVRYLLTEKTNYGLGQGHSANPMRGEWGMLRPFPEAGCTVAHSEHGSGHRESSGIAGGGSAQNTELGNSRGPQGEHVPQDNLSLLAVTWKIPNPK